MAKHDITDADLERMAAPYEDGGFEPEPDGKVFDGFAPRYDRHSPRDGNSR